MRTIVTCPEDGLDVVTMGFKNMVQHVLEGSKRQITLVSAPFASGLGGISRIPVLRSAAEVGITVPKASDLVLLIDVDVAQVQDCERLSRLRIRKDLCVQLTLEIVVQNLRGLISQNPRTVVINLKHSDFRRVAEAKELITNTCLGQHLSRYNIEEGSSIHRDHVHTNVVFV